MKSSKVEKFSHKIKCKFASRLNAYICHVPMGRAQLRPLETIVTIHPSRKCVMPVSVWSVRPAAVDMKSNVEHIRLVLTSPNSRPQPEDSPPLPAVITKYRLMLCILPFSEEQGRRQISAFRGSKIEWVRGMKLGPGRSRGRNRQKLKLFC